MLSTKSQYFTVSLNRLHPFTKKTSLLHSGSSNKNLRNPLSVLKFTRAVQRVSAGNKFFDDLCVCRNFLTVMAHPTIAAISKNGTLTIYVLVIIEIITQNANNSFCIL